MSVTKLDRRAGSRSAARIRNDRLIDRAAQRAAWAATALEAAARDLNDAHSAEGNPLTGLTELVRDQAGRTSSLADDIGSRRTAVRRARRVSGSAPTRSGR